MIVLTSRVGKMGELSVYRSGNIAISDIQIAVTHCNSLMRFRGAKIRLQKKRAQKTFE